MTIKVTIGGVETLRLADIAPAIERTVLLRMSQVAYDAMQTGAARHTKTGVLFQSIYNRSAGPERREVGHDPQRAPYAPFVIFGTRPHRIAPKKKKALRWVSGNGFVFAAKVNHPGYRGDDYMQRAADEAVRQMPAIIDKALKES